MLKAIAKKTISEHHWAFLSWCRHRFGFAVAMAAHLGLRHSGIGRAPNALVGSRDFLRPGTTDQNMYDKIFISKEQDIVLGDPKFILDAGAHIGSGDCGHPDRLSPSPD